MSKLKPETRSLSNAPTVTSGRKIRGYAATFGKRSSDLGDSSSSWHEVIEKGAFDSVLSNDVRCLQDHDSSRILGRSKAGKGSLKIGVDAVGLWYEFEAPETTVGNDLLVSLKRGDITGSSFSFIIERDSWKQEGSVLVRTIHKIKTLLDVGPVSFPAYPSTDGLSARSKTNGTEHPSVSVRRLHLEALQRTGDALNSQINSLKP
jgi:HK97 family phage prohead protease